MHGRARRAKRSQGVSNAAPDAPVEHLRRAFAIAEPPSGMSKGIGPRGSLAAQSGLSTSILISTLILLAHFLFGWAQLSDTEQDCPGFMAENATSAPTCPATFKPGGLAEAQLNVHADFDARGTLSALLGGAEQLLCNSSCPGSGIDGIDAPPLALHHGTRLARGVVDAGLGGAADAVCGAMACDSCVNVAGVQTSQHCAVDYSMIALHMSYLYGVIHLWSQDASPDPNKPSGVYPGRASGAPRKFVRNSARNSARNSPTPRLCRPPRQRRA